MRKIRVENQSSKNEILYICPLIFTICMKEIERLLRDRPEYRWGVLAIVSFIMAANYYFFDALSPLQSALETNLHFSASDYGVMQSFYSFPNTFLLMAIFGGIILDRLGIRITGSVFCGFMLLGGAVVVYSTSDYYLNGGFGYHFMNSFWTSVNPAVKMMSLGQLFFGLGAETSIVVINKILVKWFKGREIAFAFAINLSIARIGSFLAFQLTPRFDQWHVAIYFAALLLFIAFLAFFIYQFFDRKIDRQEKSDSLLTEEDIFRWSDFTGLIKNRSFIYISLICLCFYSAVFPFLKYAPNFFESKFGLPPASSSQIPSLLPLGAILFTPLFGWIVDRWGKAASLMIYGSLILTLCHVLLTVTSFTPYALIIMLGIAFSLVPAAMWPSVSRIVDERRIGTAFGTMASIQNFGMWFFTLIAGKILELTPIASNGTAHYNYTNTMIVFSGLGLLGLLFALLLRREDRIKNLGLDLPMKQKKA